MSGDIGDLFDRADRVAMSPEFRAQLVDLYEQSAVDRRSGTHRRRGSVPTRQMLHCQACW